MHPAFESIKHRPWPLPEGRWAWQQSWLDLAFIHYRVDANQLRPILPDSLALQEFDGSAWVGLVPFRMAGVARRPLTSTPFLKPFPELNLRTYVECNGKPGVWFFSLDADSWLIVTGGRWVYGLPYFSARMSQQREDEWFTFSSTRRGGDAGFQARYRPHGERYFAKDGSFEHWATERYCLYSAPTSRSLTRVQVHHLPWPLQRAEVQINHSNILAASGIQPADPEPVVHFSQGVHVVSFRPETLHQR